MFVFKILMIILIALPVIALASYFYSQMLSYIKARNAVEDEAIRQSVAEARMLSGDRSGKRAGSKKNGKKRKKSDKKEKQK